MEDKRARQKMTAALSMSCMEQVHAIVTDTIQVATHQHMCPNTVVSPIAGGRGTATNHTNDATDRH